MLTPKDLEKYHQAAERILNAMDNSPVPISWHEMDRMALQSVIAKELILIDKEAKDTDSHGTLYGSWLQHGIRADFLLHKL